MTTELNRIPDLSDPATYVAGVPHDVFDRLRAMSGLYWQPTPGGTRNGGFWAVTRAADIIEIEKDTETFTSRFGAVYPAPLAQIDNFRTNMMFNDPPEHSRLRRAAARSFGPRIIAHFEAWVREIVTEVLDDIAPKVEIDWVQEVAAVIPARVIARIIGVPLAERQVIVDATNRIFDAQIVPDGGKTLTEAFQYVRAYMGQLWKAKRQDPQEDMSTVLGQCVERGEISEAECNDYLSLLTVAGFETTHTLIGQSMRLFAESDAVRTAVTEAIDKVGAGPVVEEFLRYLTPAMNMARTAVRDVIFKGTLVREGDMMQLFFVAANRDPDIFGDPHQFDPMRKQTGHMAFGNGIHSCLGAHLARLEVRILYEEIFKRGLTITLNGEPKRGWSCFVNQLLSLPVRVSR